MGVGSGLDINSSNNSSGTSSSNSNTSTSASSISAPSSSNSGSSSSSDVNNNSNTSPLNNSGGSILFTSDDAQNKVPSFTCERVCTSDRLLRRLGRGSEQRNVPRGSCVTVCGSNQADSCTEACQKAVCSAQHDVRQYI